MSGCDTFVLPTASPPVSLCRMILRKPGMMSTPSFSYCALISVSFLTLCSLLELEFAFGPTIPGIVPLRSAENLRESVRSMLDTFTVSLSVCATE